MPDDDSQDDEPMWICGCGELVESAFHCPKCGMEPPWGCDCGLHDPEDEPDDYDADWGCDEYGYDFEDNQ